MKKKCLLLCSMLLCLTGLTACGSAGAAAADVSAMTDIPVTGTSAAVNSVTVNSSETLQIVPDIAEVVFAVQSEAADASACQQKNTEETDKVVELLKSLGLAETSIQTTNYAMSPRYSYRNDTQTLIGYEAVSELTVTDIAMDRLGGILSEAVGAGINQIYSISYQSSSYDENYQEALKLAMTGAAAKAQVLAEAGGRTLGTVINIHEDSNYSDARYNDSALASKLRSDAAVEDASLNSAVIMPGEIDVEVQLTVEYELR